MSNRRRILCCARRAKTGRGVRVSLWIDGREYDLTPDRARQLGRELLISAGIGVRMVKAEIRESAKAVKCG